MESLDGSIRKAVDTHLRGRAVLEVKDRGEWLRRLVEVTLDGNEKVFFKISVLIGELGHVPLETGLGGQRFLYEQGFPVPRILAVDDSCSISKGSEQSVRERAMQLDISHASSLSKAPKS